MEQELLLSFVKGRCQELSVPFPNLASAFMLEEAMSVIGSSYYEDHFILRNSMDLTLSNYSRHVVHELSFYYKGSFQVRDLAVVLTRTLVKEKTTPISWEMSLHMAGASGHGTRAQQKSPETEQNGVSLPGNENGARVIMKGDLGGISVPFELLLTPAPVDCPEKKEMSRFFFYPERRFSYRAYPRNKLLLDQLLEILTRMELIEGLRPYDLVYQILKTESLNGRHLREDLQKGLFERKLTAETKRLNMLLNYRDYSYMKKKWKAYLRGEKKTEPSWEEVMDLIQAFLSPLWDSLCRDEVFFGDWMPDLGRYLQ